MDQFVDVVVDEAGVAATVGAMRLDAFNGREVGGGDKILEGGESGV